MKYFFSFLSTLILCSLLNASSLCETDTIRKEDFSTTPLKHWKFVGEGGYGVVFKAFNLQDSSISAIKINKKQDKATDKEEHFLKLITCDPVFKDTNKHLLTLTDQLVVENVNLEYTNKKEKKFVINGSQRLLVFPFFVTDLAQLLKKERKTLPVRKIKHYSENILDGIVALHKGGIIHRDIKPGNIFISNQDKAVIGDFGLSIFATEKRKSRAGTPCYTAPEVIKATKSKGYGPKADVWSFGVILYEMVYGNKLLYCRDKNVKKIKENTVKFMNSSKNKSLLPIKHEFNFDIVGVLKYLVFVPEKIRINAKDLLRIFAGRISKSTINKALKSNKRKFQKILKQTFSINTFKNSSQKHPIGMKSINSPVTHIPAIKGNYSVINIIKNRAVLPRPVENIRSNQRNKRKS